MIHSSLLKPKYLLRNLLTDIIGPDRGVEEPPRRHRRSESKPNFFRDKRVFVLLALAEPDGKGLGLGVIGGVMKVGGLENFGI